MVMSLKLKPGKQRYVNHVSGRKKVSCSTNTRSFVLFMVLFVILEDVLSCKLGRVRKNKLATIHSNSVQDSHFIEKNYSTENKFVNLLILFTRTY
jgi:hypothetical protein